MLVRGQASLRRMADGCRHRQAKEIASEQPWRVAPLASTYERMQIVPNAPSLMKSLGDAAEHLARLDPPADAREAAARRQELTPQLRTALGLNPLPERTQLNARVVARHDLPGYAVENVVFESRPGFFVTANVYLAGQRAERRPAILCPIGHYLSAGKTAGDVQARCIQLAQLGFVVLTYDAIGQGERMVEGNIHHDAGFALLPLGDTVAGWMVWDSIRAMDYLQSRDDVDPQRIGVTGNSGGGLNTLYTAAVDERVAAAVVVGYTFEFRNLLKYGGTHCTCNHLPGLFREFEWCDVAGLIAPRPLMTIHGGHDGIFPISGARRAARNTHAWYAAQEAAPQHRFVELVGEPHAYTQPFRQPMYGWFTWHLLHRGQGEPLAETAMDALPEQDVRLLCDPDRTWMPQAPTVVDHARRLGLQAIAQLPDRAHSDHQQTVRQWARELTAPPNAHPHYLAPVVVQEASSDNGRLEKLSFLSEEGAMIPGLLWLPVPPRDPARVIVIVDSHGKATVAESGWVEPLRQAGCAVLALDLRGRGETLGRNQFGWDTNFRLVTNQLNMGQPLAGRRAFDLTRAIDYVETRAELDPHGIVVVGLHDDALSALLAAAVDDRVSRLALGSFYHSFLSQMRCRRITPRERLRDEWNDPQLDGLLHTPDDDIDFGSAIPAALRTTDIPDLLSLIAPRPVLCGQARDLASQDSEMLTSRFRALLESTPHGDGSNLRYLPRQPFDVQLLLDWLNDTEPSPSPSQ